jgi:hypothetical protein
MGHIVAAAQLGKQQGKQVFLGVLPELPLLARIDGPSVVHPEAIAELETYRDAVRYCFMYRRTTGMCRKRIAELAGMPQQHIGEYLSVDPGKRDMPAKYITEFEAVCGNSAVSQWIALQAKLTVLEEMQARRAA